MIEEEEWILWLYIAYNMVSVDHNNNLLHNEWTTKRWSSFTWRSDILFPKLHTLKDLFWQSRWRVEFLNYFPVIYRKIKTLWHVIQHFSSSGCSKLITSSPPCKPLILAIQNFLKCLKFVSLHHFMCFYLKCSFSVFSLKSYLRYHFLW